MVVLRPSEIYFTQDSISSTFGRRTAHNRRKIGDTLDDLMEGRCSIRNVPTISVMKENGKWWTADNRRLWVFRYLEKLGKCTTIPVSIVYNIDSRKRSTTNGGTDVRIYRGNDPGGTWHRKVSSIKIPEKPVQEMKDVSTEIPVKEKESSQIKETLNSDISNKEKSESYNIKLETTAGIKCHTIDVSHKINVQQSTLSSKYAPKTVHKCNFLENIKVLIRQQSDVPRISKAGQSHSESFLHKTKANGSGCCKRKSILKKTLKFKAKLSNNYHVNFQKLSNCVTPSVQKKVRFYLPTKLYCSPWEPLYVIAPSRTFHPLIDDENEEDDSYSPDEDEIFHINRLEYLDSHHTFEGLVTDNEADSVIPSVKSNPFDNWEIDTDDDSSSDSEDHFRCYDLTYGTERHPSRDVEFGYLSDDQYSDDMEDDNYTSILDRIYSDGCYDSDSDNNNTIYDYVY